MQQSLLMDRQVQGKLLQWKDMNMLEAKLQQLTQFSHTLQALYKKQELQYQVIILSPKTMK